MADRFAETYPAPLRQAEEEAIRTRRGSGDSSATVGLALSGGGIRSATFSLGVLQALAKHGLLSRIDYVSTVSGGGYIGAFLGALFLPGRWARAAVPATAGAEAGQTEKKTTAQTVAEVLTDPYSKPLRWLRESGRYLSPNGAGDALIALAAYLRNWITIHVVLATLLLVPVALVRLAGHGVDALVGRLPPALEALVPVNPLFLLPLLGLVLWSLPAGAAYWWNPRFLALLLILIAGLAGILVAVPVSPRVRLSAVTLAAVLGLVVITGLYFRFRYPDALARRRNLTDGLKLSLVVAFALAAVALVDTLGFVIHQVVVVGRRFWAPLIAAPAVAIPFTLAQKYAPRLLAVVRPRIRLSPELVTSAIGIFLIVLELSVLSALIQGLPLAGTAAVAAGALVASVFMGRTQEFLNLSSHSTLYTARLTRAYLGASNPDRHRYCKSLIDPIPGDDVEMHDYRPHEHGGPLHLLNVTLNETLGGETQVEYRDRKGLNVAVGPCAITVGARHHALAQWASPETAGRPAWRRVMATPPRVRLTKIAPARGYQIFAPQKLSADPLTLGRWVAVSGAAFTTGLGSRTHVGLSLLLGLANIRLGYWWASGCDPAQRKDVTHVPDVESFWKGFTWLLPVQAHLMDEFLARFYGPARPLWYLSDGGHFDNTGVYELVRRRIPIIIACDNGADPDYSWQDVGDLVRKLRIDFNAEVRFLEPEELEGRITPKLKGYFAPWHAFRRFERPAVSRSLGRRPPADSDNRPYASLAEVSYLDSTDHTTILFIKPNLRRDESADLLTYWSSHKDFPQETTLDQYFDEAQWESYRRLGEHIGSRLFQPYAGARWTPNSLRPL